MKKLLMTVLATFLILALNCPKAAAGTLSDDGDRINLSLVPLLEGEASAFSTAKGMEAGFGNTSLYALFEGEKGNFGWTVSTLFIQAAEDCLWPYKELGKSSSSNFLNLCDFSWTPGKFTLSAGKQVLLTGGTEYEDWDWDMHVSLASPQWLTLSCYQWGASAAWNPAKGTSLAYQLAASPFGEHPFEKGLLTHSFKWWGEYGFADFIWSASAIERPGKHFDWLFSLGQTFYFSKRSNLSFDWNNNFGFVTSGMIRGNTFNTRFRHALNEKVELGASFLYSRPDAAADLCQKTAGLFCHWSPLEDLRLHVTTSFDHNNRIFCLTIGGRWYIRLVK